jgi:Zn-dependent protease with chaperone function
MPASIAPLLAALVRPNALDREVDRIPAAALLSKPAGALVDPARQLAAIRLEHWLVSGWFFALLLQVIVLAYFWQSGSAARVRDALRRRFEHEWTVRFFFGAALALVARLAALLPDVYVFQVNRLMGLSSQLLRSWGAEWLLNTVLAMIVVGIVIVCVLWLVDRTHQWYLYTMAGIFAVSFAIAFIAPFVPDPFSGGYRPLPEGIAARIRPDFARAGYSGVPIVVREKKYSNLGIALVQGLGSTQRVVLSDPLLAASSIRELRFVAAYELGFVALDVPAKLALVDALFVIFGTAIAVGIADRIPFRRDDDPVSRLALVAALLGCVYVLIAPIDNAIRQGYSVKADTFAIALTHERAPAVRAIVRQTNERMEEVCPDLTARFFMMNTAGASTRISRITGVPSGCP